MFAMQTHISSEDGCKPTLPLAAAFRRLKAPSDLIEYALVDAFTDKEYKGNPAAVVLLSVAKDEKWMQLVAAEFNVSETAFVRRSKSHQFEGAFQTDEVQSMKSSSEQNEADDNNEYQIRWFTPTTEVNLCGHGTLASAHVLFSTGLVRGDTIIFYCKSGKLITRRVDPTLPYKKSHVPKKSGETPSQVLELDFPMIRVSPCDESEIKYLSTTLSGIEVISIGRSTTEDLIVELSTPEDVENLHPQMHEIVQCNGRGFHVTARDRSDSNTDFVSRCFFPKFGVNEDPVCGSAHCALTSFWAEKLGKDSLEAHQVSKRGGRLSLRLDSKAERVYLSGGAITVMAGVLLV